MQLILQCGICLLVGCVLTLVFFGFTRRRGARTTQREVAVAAPRTTTEIQAEKDQMRAEFVQSVRRLEIGVERIREKALARLGPADRGAAEVGRLKAELDEKAALIRTLRARAEWHKTVARRIVRPLLYMFARVRRRQRPILTAPPLFKFEQGPQWEFKKPPVQGGYASAPAAPQAIAHAVQNGHAAAVTFADQAQPGQNGLAVTAPALAATRPAQREPASAATPLVPKAQPAQNDLAATAAAIAAVNLKRRRAISNKI